VTRGQIIQGLEDLVGRLADPSRDEPPAGLELHEWTYIKGLASGVVMQLRDRLIEAGQ
jgi:hypothetical protein